MTFCQDMGYKVGDKFRVTSLAEVEGFTPGQTVTLYKDDGTYMPLFEGVNTRFSNCEVWDESTHLIIEKEGAYLSLDYVELLK